MIGVICITATLVFDESESADRVSMQRSSETAIAPCLGDIQSACSASWSGNVASHKASIAKGELELGGRGDEKAAGRRREDMSRYRARLSIDLEDRLGRGRKGGS